MQQELSHHTIKFRILNDQSNFPERHVHVPTSKEEIKFFADNGYLVVDDFLPPEQLEVFRREVRQVTEEEVKAGSKENYPGNAVFVRHIFDKIPPTLVLLTSERLLGISRAALGPQIQISEIVARTNLPGHKDHQLHWHIHNRVVPDPLPPFFAYPHAIDALIYLDDVSIENGPLCVLPGSHRAPHFYIEGRDFSDRAEQRVIPTKAGTCVFIHANLWHRALPIRQNAGYRSLIMIEISPSWLKAGLPLGLQNGIKPKQQHVQKLLDSEDEETKELLGKFHW